MRPSSGYFFSPYVPVDFARIDKVYVVMHNVLDFTNASAAFFRKDEAEAHAKKEGLFSNSSAWWVEEVDLYPRPNDVEITEVDDE